MVDLKLFSLFLFVAHIECQGLLSGISGRQNPIDRLPGVGACDRIATRGVGNCMQNFLPTSILSSFTGGSSSGSGGDICCNYSKYRACINGLHAGLKIAMEREKCPKSYSTRIIKSIGESSAGPALKSACGNGGGSSKCPKTSSTKPKRNQKPPKRTQTRNEEEPLGGLGGIGGLGGLGGVFQPARDVLDRGTGRGSSKDNSPLGLGGFGNVFQPVGDIFGRGIGRGSGSESNPLGGIGDMFNRGRETFEQGASTVVGGLQNVFGGFANLGRNNN